jgi:hypothetical protein
MITTKVSKTLSRNDTGETGGHQAGITITKFAATSGVFPEMTIRELNPRVTLMFHDFKGRIWTFEYIYYNDVFFGKPRFQSHNEHRLTCTLQFTREYELKAGDEIWFAIDENGTRYIGYDRHYSLPQNKEAEDEKSDLQEQLNKNDEFVLKLSGSWKQVKYKI